MSHFQIGLVVLGGLVFAAVVVWSLWLTPRSTPKRPRPQRTSVTHAAAPKQQAKRREPGLAAEHAESSVPQLVPSYEETKSIAEPPTEPAPTGIFAQTIGLPEMGNGLNPLIDVIVPLLLEPKVSAIPGGAALAAIPRLRRVGNKPFSIEGKNQISGLWERPELGRYYDKFQAGVQLANRAGPLSTHEFSEFVTKVNAFAQPLGLRPQFPDLAETLATAEALDQFASAHDRQLVFVLYARKIPWTAEQVNEEAGCLGFINVAHTPGSMVLPQVESDYSVPPTPLLKLAYHKPATTSLDPEQSAVRALTITLDATHVPRDENAFERLSVITTALCQELNGILCDQDGHPLLPEAMQAIAAGLDDLYLSLEQHKLPAGAAVTRRLFS